MRGAQSRFRRATKSMGIFRTRCLEILNASRGLQIAPIGIGIGARHADASPARLKHLDCSPLILTAKSLRATITSKRTYCH
jgi:hypothetical protein